MDIVSPPSCISLGQANSFYLKEIRSDNNKETKLPVSYLTAACGNLARGNGRTFLTGKAEQCFSLATCENTYQYFLRTPLK